MQNKEVSQRQLRVGQEIKKVIAALIERGEIRNLQELPGVMVTITEARVSPDLKISNVYFIARPVEKNDVVLEALQLAANYLRKQVAARTELRYVPELRFRVDETYAEVAKIESLLRDPKVARDLAKKTEEE